MAASFSMAVDDRTLRLPRAPAQPRATRVLPLAAVTAFLTATLAVAATGLYAARHSSNVRVPDDLAALAPAGAGATRTISLIATGDISMGRTPILPPDGGAGLFRGVRRSLAGDVVLGNLEGTLTTASGSKCGAGSPNCFAFRVPPSYGRHLKQAGFTVMNLANNHAYDFGARGLAQTRATLRRLRLRETGRPGEITIQRVRGVRVALLGFAPYRWAQSLLDIGAAQRLVRRATTRADIVVVTMHAGAEGVAHAHVRPGPETYLGEPRGNAVAFSHAVIRAGADLVVGSGPHVLRGIEWFHARPIVYSLGNFAGYRTFATSGILGVSAILHARLTRTGEWAGGSLVATRLVGTGTPVLDRAGSAYGLVRRLSASDFGRRAVRVNSSGTLIPPR